MKQLLFLCIATLLFTPRLFGQIYVNGENLNEKEGVHYCTLEIRELFITVAASVDYGQTVTIKNAGKQKITNATGKTAAFASSVGAFNYMEENGWDYIERIPTKNKTDGKIDHHYLFRKRK